MSCKTWTDYGHLIACTGGVITTLLVYGVCQERLLTRTFDGDAYFDHSLFLVLCNRLTTIGVAVGMLINQGGLAALRPAAPVHAYAFVSVANVAATACQYEALKYVSFGAQTLSKCLKPVPVMAWGVLWMKRRYSRSDVATTAAVMAGCWLFMGGGGSVAHRVGVDSTTTTATIQLFGTALLASYLAADGLTSTLQARMFDRGPGVLVANQVLHVSLCSCVLSVLGLAFQRTRANPPGIAAALAFCADHPSSMAWIAALAASATASSLMITATVRHYGPLVLSLAMSARQLGSVLISAAMSGRALTGRQTAGVVLVFGALFGRGASRATRESSKGLGQAATCCKAPASLSPTMPTKFPKSNPASDESSAPTSTPDPAFIHVLPSAV